MLVKPADISPLECLSTNFLTGLPTFLDIYKVQSLAEHLTDRTASRSWTLQLLNILSEAQRIYVHKTDKTRPQPAGETHKPDSLPVSSSASLMRFQNM